MFYKNFLIDYFCVMHFAQSRDNWKMLTLTSIKNSNQQNNALLSRLFEFSGPLQGFHSRLCHKRDVKPL